MLELIKLMIMKRRRLTEADINLLAPKILKWEGGYANDPVDRGGATKMGVTIGTATGYYKKGAKNFDKNGDGQITADDIKALTKEDFMYVLRKFWDHCRADEIKNQSIAEIIVDWAWGSGPGTAMKKVSNVLGLRPSTKMTDEMLAKINGWQSQEDLFNKIWHARESHFNGIVSNNPSQRKFIKGWMNRLKSYTFDGKEVAPSNQQQPTPEPTPAPAPTPTQQPSQEVPQPSQDSTPDTDGGDSNDLVSTLVKVLFTPKPAPAQPQAVNAGRLPYPTWMMINEIARKNIDNYLKNNIL